MCVIGPDAGVLAAQVKLVADAEFSLEESLRKASEYQKAAALEMLERRKDERALSILRDYLRPLERAPLGLDADEAAAIGV